MRSVGTTAQAYQSKLYSEFAQFYDLVFARIFYRRIASVIRDLGIPPGAKVLELGVGTGLSLAAYPSHCRVTGVDLAPDMLEHAQERIDRHGWHHVRVMEMDAMELKFVERSFDFVMAFHVVSVVPDAGRLMGEARRVCRADGKLIVINHFRSEKRMLAALDRRMEPLTRRVGWHTLRRADVFDGLPLDIERVYKTSRRSLFTIVVARNLEEAGDRLASEPAAGAGSVSAGVEPRVDGHDSLAH